MSVIVYELNEVPRKIFDFYAMSHPNSAFAKLREHSSLFQTHTADIGSLSPWITWPTMHRGVSNIKHEISDLGQNLTQVNLEYPNIYNILAKYGVKVGVFGSLQTYPLPVDLKNFEFYVPDTYAAGDECFPDELSAYQIFNLSMVRGNKRNVSAGIAVKDAMRFIQKSIKLGLTSKTFLKLSKQLISERVNHNHVVRRRSSHAEIAFDIYFRQLINTKPDISFFFTNHLASSMHRYWPTIFPNDYEIGRFEKSWRKQWLEEIPHAVKVANYQLQALLNYCDSNGSELILCSSMGQAAVLDAKPVQKKVLLTNLNSLMNYLGAKKQDWEPRYAMSPQIILSPKTRELKVKINRLNDITINDKKIKFHETSSGEIRLEIGLFNQEILTVLDKGKEINPKEIGIENVDLQDAAGAYAYHIPEGILLHYKPSMKLDKKNVKDWTSISVLDFAPSILNKFEKDIPSYMQKDNIFLSS
jgi:hypothetical protein